MRPSNCDNPEHRVVGSGALSSRVKSRSIRIGSSDGKPTVSSTGNSRPNKSVSNANSTSLSVLVLSESRTEAAGSKLSKGGSSSGAQGATSHGSNYNPSKSATNGTTSSISGSELHESQSSERYKAALGPWSA
jgi:hypothetical protein